METHKESRFKFILNGFKFISEQVEKQTNEETNGIIKELQYQQENQNFKQ